MQESIQSSPKTPGLSPDENRGPDQRLSLDKEPDYAPGWGMNIVRPMEESGPASPYSGIQEDVKGITGKIEGLFGI